MDLTVQIAPLGQEDQSWLGSAHGTSSCRPVTLDPALFTAGTHYPNGFVPSGCALGMVTATGKYGPYTPGASNGTQTFAGFLFTSQRMNVLTTQAIGPLLEHGRVITAKLPFQSGAGAIDTAAKTAAPLIKFV